MRIVLSARTAGPWLAVLTAAALTACSRSEPPAAPAKGPTPAPAAAVAAPTTAPAAPATPPAGAEAVDAALAAAQAFDGKADEAVAAATKAEARLHAAAQKAQAAAARLDAATPEAQRAAATKAITAAQAEANAANALVTAGQETLADTQTGLVAQVDAALASCTADPALAAYAGCAALTTEKATLQKALDALTARYTALETAARAERPRLEEAAATVALAR